MSIFQLPVYYFCFKFFQVLKALSFFRYDIAYSKTAKYLKELKSQWEVLTEDAKNLFGIVSSNSQILCIKNIISQKYYFTW